jgi:quercetin 2,3-dioxygenase
MMTIRSSEQRGHFKNNWLDSYHTFSFGSYYDPEHLQFGALRVINQDVIDAKQGFDFHGHKDMEIFTYVLSGSLEHQDSMGNKEQIRANEVQIMSAGTGVLHSEYNPSETQKVELLQIWVMPEQYGLTPRYAQKNFSREDKLNNFRLVISPSEENGSLKIYQQVWVWASVFEKDFEKSFSLQNGEKLWLHVANGEIQVDGHVLKKGDALKIEEQTALKIKGLASESEFVMMELA